MSDAGNATRRRFVRLDPRSWSGALTLVLALTAVVWGVQLVNDHGGYRLDRFGLGPRAVSGLWGVATMPFLHAGWGHLLSNTVPLLQAHACGFLAGAALGVVLHRRGGEQRPIRRRAVS